MISHADLINRIFKDKQGNRALVAAPNPPIIIWALATVASHILKHGAAHKVLSYISLAALIVWALLEISKGVNYFRRALGLVVLAATLYSRFHQ